MTNYREILRLASLGLSQQNIADSSGVSRKTVNRVLKRARELDIFWPLEPDETDAVLVDKLFPSTLKQVSSTKRMPDFDYIRKEPLRNGVNKKLLWTEYLEECRQSAFCGARRIPMHFRADAMHNITDALKHLAFRINSWAGSLRYSALWPSSGSH